MPKRKIQLMTLKSSKPAKSGSLVRDVRALIEQAREHVARAVNSGLVALYWQVGKRIQQETLQGKRAGYGEKIISTLSRQLINEYCQGFSDKNLHRMVQFYKDFPKQEIVSTLSRQLSWSHFVEILVLKDDLKRDFYAEMCHIENWSVRTLLDKISGMLY